MTPSTMLDDTVGFAAICRTTDVPNGGNRAFTVSGQDVLVVNLSHEFHVVRNQCTHLEFPLTGSRVIGCEIICRAHGAKFNLRTGKASGPAIESLQVFDTLVSDGVVRAKLAAKPPMTSARPWCRTANEE